jgi:hypothetical protein
MATTTKFWTWTEIWTKLKTETDLDDDDDFIDEAEAMGYANDSIDEAESNIHTLYQDYFLSRGTITLVDGTDEYALPTTIYAHKIRKIVYYNGSNIYEVRRIRGLDKFIQYRHSRTNSTSTEDYCYFITNTTPGSPKITFSPVAYESGQRMEVWFIRQANRLASGSDVCDIPEFAQFVFDYLKERIEWKRAAGSGRHLTAVEKLKVTRQDMVDTLQTMIPDEDNEIVADMSHYEDLN